MTHTSKSSYKRLKGYRKSKHAQTYITRCFSYVWWGSIYMGEEIKLSHFIMEVQVQLVRSAARCVQQLLGEANDQMLF